MKCKFCNIELEAHHHFDMNTPIGLQYDSEALPKPPDYLWCPKCGLMYQKIEG